MKGLKKISIIIPTYSRGAELIAILEQLDKMSLFELIVVDQTSNYSIDYEKRLFNLINANKNVYYYTMPTPNVSKARNFGVSKSTGDFILFLDDDISIPDDFIQKYQNYISNDSTWDAISGLIIGYDRCLNYSLSKSYYHKDFGYLFKPLNYAYKLRQTDLPAGNMLIKKDVFLRLGGFDEKLSRLEDSDFTSRFLKAGYRSVYEPDLYLIHKAVSYTNKPLTLFANQTYWGNCVYLILKNWGLWKGRMLLLYYLRSNLITRPILLKPKIFFKGMCEFLKGYKLAKSKMRKHLSPVVLND